MRDLLTQFDVKRQVFRAMQGGLDDDRRKLFEQDIENSKRRAEQIKYALSDNNLGKFLFSNKCTPINAIEILNVLIRGKELERIKIARGIWTGCMGGSKAEKVIGEIIKEWESAKKEAESVDLGF